jgi:septal ring factor EnvC (AmiA/AmiB activator)
MRRAYRRGQFPNATKTTSGTVSIPITDLLAAGYTPNAATPKRDTKPTAEATKATESQAGQATQETAALRDTIATLEANTRRLESQVAELKAEKAQLLDLMGLQLRALNAGTEPQATQSRPWWRIGRA